jgi:hypothetical protein
MALRMGQIKLGLVISISYKDRFTLRSRKNPVIRLDLQRIFTREEKRREHNAFSCSLAAGREPIFRKIPLTVDRGR